MCTGVQLGCDVSTTACSLFAVWLPTSGADEDWSVIVNVAGGGQAVVQAQAVAQAVAQAQTVVQTQAVVLPQPIVQTQTLVPTQTLEPTQPQDAVPTQIQAQDGVVGAGQVSTVPTQSAHHRPGRYMCSRCGRAYKYLPSLRNHQNMECGQEPRFACSYCNYRGKHKHHLISHLRTRHPELPDIL